jgi:predicted transcriptional regulator
MNKRLRQFERESGLEIFGLGAKRLPWEAALEKYAELIVRECAGLFPNVYVEIEHEYGHTPVVAADYIKKHFGVGK